ncbi:MAG: transposase [Solirubrobacteraceae bacterium]
MAQNFIGVDRDQVFLMPPSLRDWLPEDHLVWTVLESVEEMDLTAFYSSYRADGHGRPAYDPSMVLALLLYAYSQGNRSSRRIERECREDVAYRVIAANRVPDHSTIAEFRCRHERAIADLFGEVLGLCRAAGMVNVGVIVVDGTKVHANASNMANRDYRQIALEILKEADRIDREEDELYGDQRGDELPEHLRTAEGRRAALKEAKRRLDEERAAKREQQSNCAAGGDRVEEEDLGTGLELDPEVIVARVQGRQGWSREARRQLDSRREQDPRPVPAFRLGRLLVGEHKLAEDLAVELEASRAYEAWRARGVAADGSRRMAPGTTRPYVPPAEPAGKVNTTDPDSKNVKAFRGYVQGYNAQAVVTEQQIVIAAEVNTDPQDFSHLGPMVTAAGAELERAGVSDDVGVVLADAGYWHFQQMDELAAQGIPVLIPPDSTKRKTPRPGWDGGRYAWMRRLLATELGRELYSKRHQTIEPVFGQIKYNRRIDRFQRRGRAAVRSEWRLAAMTHNLLKLHQHRIAAAGA